MNASSQRDNGIVMSKAMPCGPDVVQEFGYFTYTTQTPGVTQRDAACDLSILPAAELVTGAHSRLESSSKTGRTFPHTGTCLLFQDGIPAPWTWHAEVSEADEELGTEHSRPPTQQVGFPQWLDLETRESLVIGGDHWNSTLTRSVAWSSISVSL